jgi:ATP-dependent DNA ligase
LIHAGPNVHSICSHVRTWMVDDGQVLLEAAERHGLEGVVSKRRDAPYRSGECGDWRKVKTTASRKGTGSDRVYSRRSGSRRGPDR